MPSVLFVCLGCVHSLARAVCAVRSRGPTVSWVRGRPGRSQQRYGPPHRSERTVECTQLTSASIRPPRIRSLAPLDLGSLASTRPALPAQQHLSLASRRGRVRRLGQEARLRHRGRLGWVRSSSSSLSPSSSSPPLLLLLRSAADPASRRSQDGRLPRRRGARRAIRRDVQEARRSDQLAVPATRGASPLLPLFLRSRSSLTVSLPARRTVTSPRLTTSSAWTR